MQARKEIRAMVRIALSVAFLCVSAMISFPFFAVPITLQSFAVFAILSLLGWRAGGAAILSYLALGAVGLPVFSGFTGGVGILFGQTGGFLFGFLLAVPVFALIRGIKKESKLVSLCAMAGGLLADYLSGALWYYFGFNTGADISLWEIFVLCVFPFLIPDGIKIFLAVYISKRLSTFNLDNRIGGTNGNK